MFNFAHNGVHHKTNTEAIAHILEENLWVAAALCFGAFILVTYLIYRKRLNAQTVRNKNEKE